MACLPPCLLLSSQPGCRRGKESRMNRSSVEEVPLFASVPKREHGKLASLADEIEVPAGTKVMTQGEYAREFAVIVEGNAAVIRDGEHVRTLGPGEFFG